MMSLWDALRMNMMISYQELVRTFLNTGVRNNGLLNIKPTEFMQTKVPVPCFEEQESIADMLYNSSRTIRVLQDKLACLKDEKKALMQQLLTGKRRVKVDEAVAE